MNTGSRTTTSLLLGTIIYFGAFFLIDINTPVHSSNGTVPANTTFASTESSYIDNIAAADNKSIYNTTIPDTSICDTSVYDTSICDTSVYDITTSNMSISNVSVTNINDAQTNSTDDAQTNSTDDAQTNSTDDTQTSSTDDAQTNSTDDTQTSSIDDTISNTTDDTGSVTNINDAQTNSTDDTTSSSNEENDDSLASNNSSNPESYNDIWEHFDEIKNKIFDNDQISLDDFKNTGAYQGANKQTQDCIDLAAKIGSNLIDYEIVRCSEDQNFFKNQIVNNNDGNSD